MLIMCAYCGQQLDSPLQDGITTCNHCNRCFDSSPFNRLLSAYWLAKRRNYIEEAPLQKNGFSEVEAILVIAFINSEFSYQEFFAALNKLAVSKVHS